MTKARHKGKDPAAARALALARYQTTSIPRMVKDEDKAAAEEATDLINCKVSPAETPDDALSSAGATEADHVWEAVQPDDSTIDGAVAASSVGSTATSAITVLPTSHGWERMITRKVSTADLQAARKYGSHEAVEGGHIYRHLGVAFVTDESAKLCITCWKEKLKPADLLKGQALHVRTCKGREGRIIGTGGGVIKALQAQLGVSVIVLGTGHVQVSGQEVAVEHAKLLLDDLIDGDGDVARGKLSNHLRSSGLLPKVTT